MTPATHRNDLDGVLLLDKPAGPSSNQALQRVKRVLGARKAGHAGTLDPLATGLLPILLGEATKFAGSLAASDKEYQAIVLLGTTTSTGDVEGNVLRREVVDVCEEQIREVVERFVGEIDQVPPMHSALKFRGRALYEYARRGETIEREHRRAIIEALTVTELRGSEFDMRVRCSKGTYIRVLAEDIGRALGCGATLKALRRIAVGRFGVETASTLEALESRGTGWASTLILPMDIALDDMPALWLDSSDSKRIRSGQVVAGRATSAAEVSVRLYDLHASRFIGIGKAVGGAVRPDRLVGQSACSSPVGREKA